MTISRLIARPLLSSVFFVGAVTALRNADASATKAASVTDKLVPMMQKAVPAAPLPTDAKTWVRINAAVQIVAAAALATGRSPRLSSAVLATSLVPTTIAGHAFWSEQDPAAKKTHLLQFAKNTSVVGGLLIAANDTDGKPGVAWRAGRAAKDARREARHLASAARREAKLAKAQLT